MQSKKIKKWEFRGNVTSFGKIIYRGWRARTIAASERKAYSNFMYQYKQQHNMDAGTRIALDGDIEEIDI